LRLSALPSRMPLNALLYASTAGVVFAARRGLETSGGTVTQVMQSIGSLLEQHGDSPVDLISKFAITPGVTTSLNEALNNVILELEQNVESKIKDGHQATQVAIDESIDQVQQKTDTAVEQKADADGKDSTWFNCVRSEQANRIAIEAAETALADSRTLETEKCQEQEDARLFDWQVPASYDFAFACDFQESGNCDQQLVNYQSQIDEMVAGLNSELNAAKEKFTVAKQGCDDAKADHVQKQSELDTAEEQWGAQRTQCLQNHEDRQISMCLFGAELQLKCAAVTSHEELVGKVDEAGTSEHSEADRRDEWDTVSLTKCMLQAVVAGGDVDTTTLTACEADVDYARDVGTLDRRESKFNDLTSAEKFTCSETTITFQGQTWEITNDGKTSSDYKVKEDYHPEVSLVDGSLPFAFCDSGDTTGPGKR